MNVLFPLHRKFVTGEYYETQLLAKCFERILTQIEKEVSSREGMQDEELVVIHPTPYTLNLMEVAENEVHFQRIVTSLATTIDIKKMYAFGLFDALNISRGTSSSKVRDEETEKVFFHLVDLFCRSPILGNLQQYVRDMVDSVEKLGWLPHGEKEDGCPFIPFHYVIIYLPSTGEYIARDIDGRHLSIHFINRLASQLKPRSTVSFMRERYFSMEMIRNYKMMSLHYASRPLYVTRERESKAPETDQQMLDVKIVNQNKVNETLENMISHNLPGVASKQRMTSTKNNWSNFVQQISSDVVEKNKTNTKLKQKLKEIVKCQSEGGEEGGGQAFTPFSRHLEEGVDVAGSHLSVSSLDITEEENQYEREWICASFGGVDDHRASHNTHGRQQVEGGRRSTEVTSSFLEKKAVFYQNIIIYELLSSWLNEKGIPLAVIPSESNTMNVNKLMEMKSFFSTPLFSMLLSHATNVPLHYVVAENDY